MWRSRRGSPVRRPALPRHGRHAIAAARAPANPTQQPHQRQLIFARPPPADRTSRPFEVHVPDEDLADLRRRIAAARWPTGELVADREQGVQLATRQALTRYWTTEYDWRVGEARLNAVPQFKTEIDGEDVHFIHVKSRHDDALPLTVTHGWPGSVWAEAARHFDEQALAGLVIAIANQPGA